MAEAEELKQMVLSFGRNELVELLEIVGMNKNGATLLQRAVTLINYSRGCSVPVQIKIRDLYRQIHNPYASEPPQSRTSSRTQQQVADHRLFCEILNNTDESETQFVEDGSWSAIKNNKDSSTEIYNTPSVSHTASTEGKDTAVNLCDGGVRRTSNSLRQLKACTRPAAMSGMDPRRMEPRLIKDISNEISTEFSMLRIYLGFTEAQFARLKHAYRNMDDQIFAMLNAWHDVVVRCGENPRHLLAAALNDCQNRYLAVTKLVTPTELDGLKGRKREPREETKRQIEQISFSVPGDMAGSGPIYNYGAPNAVNVFAGGSFTNHAALPFATEYLVPSKSDSTPVVHGQFKKPKDNSMTQKQMAVYTKMMESVGVIMCCGSELGTGFRVGARFIMTANHLVSTILDPYSTQTESPKNLDSACINFSDKSNDPSPIKYKLTRNVVYRNEQYDIAILEIAHPDGQLPQALPLRKEKLPAFNSLQEVALIGYGTPDKKGKNIEFECKVVYPDSPNVQSAFAYFIGKYQDFVNNLTPGTPETTVKKGYAGLDDRYKILLHCFMEKGASGSPMLADVSKLNPNVQVVGVLTHGLPEMFFCLTKEGQKIMKDEYRFEAGTRMAYIYKNMLTINTDLANDIFMSSETTNQDEIDHMDTA